MRFYYRGLVVLLLCISTSFVSVGALAEDDLSIMLVLDASGSMWGQIEGKAKVLIAREVIADLLSDWDTNIALGLTVYGHRREGDCEDIEVVIPMSQAGPDAVLKAVNKIRPKGKTPLSAAVQRAADELRYKELRSTVLLVTDGKENCDLDPCEVGAQLAMDGIDFTCHVIGFDVKKEDQAGLQCLADNTGGLFLAADDAAGLRDALFKTVEKAKEPPAPVVEDPGEATLEAPEEVSAGSKFKVHWEGPDSRGDFIPIVPQDAPENVYGRYAYVSKGNPVELTAPDKPGPYELRYVFAHTHKILAKRTIVVTPVEATVAPPAEAAAGSNFEVAWTGPDNQGDYISIAQLGASDKEHLTYTYTSRGTPAMLRAPGQIGEYEVRYVTGQSNSVLARANMILTGVSGKVEAPGTVAAGSDIKVAWEGPNYQSDYICIVKPDAPDTEHLSYTYTSTGNPVTIKAPGEPGEYEIRYIFGQTKKALARTDIVLTGVIGSVAVQSTAPVGSKLQVSWEGPNYSGDYIAIVPPEAADKDYLKYTYTSRGNPLKIQAPPEPGDYEVRYILGQTKKALARASVTLTPITGKVEVAGTAPAGSEFPITWEGPNYQGDYITIVPPEAADKEYLKYTYTSSGNPLKLQAPPEPGEYEVRYILGQTKKALARANITLTPISATVAATGPVSAGTKFKVTWEGPDYRGDFIAVALEGSTDKDYINYTYTSSGNPLDLKAPDDPGEYEVRYILNQNKKALARSPVEVKAQ